MQARKPDPRFNQFVEQFNAQGVAIGFKLSGNQFLFEYDDFGGWRDQKGRIYNKDGILESDGQSQEEDESDIDDQIVDEFQQMLMQEQEGIIRKQKTKKEDVPVTSSQSSQVNYEQETKKYIDKLKNKQEVRQGLSQQLFIYFKMKSSHFERIKPEVEKKQDLKSKNQLIEKIKAQIVEKRNALLENNKAWLQEEFFLDHSGTSVEEGAYDRYWYGWVKVSHDKFFETINQLKSSKQFANLKSKTFYALKSKFYLKNKMKETISQLRKKISQVPENGVVQISFNNLPEDFPLSLILDFVQYCGGHLQDVEDIDIQDNFTAFIVVKKRTADLIMNIEGYCHDEKEYVWLDVKDLAREMKFNKNFNIEVDAAFKLPVAEISDTLALTNSREQVLKFCDQDSDFRLVVNEAVIKKILMFRGQTLNIVRIVRFEKKQESK